MYGYRISASESAYGASSGYSARPLTYPDSKLLRFAEDGYEAPFSMAADAATLRDLLDSPYDSPPDSLVDQVFGNQQRQHHLALEHLAHLLDERARLHRRMVADIAHRHMALQQELFGAKLHYQLDNHRRATRVEGMLMQLEEQKRREELTFWKDSVELREKLFELTRDYEAIRRRSALLSGVTPTDVSNGGTRYA